MHSLPVTLGHTGLHGQMWQYPKAFISGHRDRSVSEPAEFGAVRGQFTVTGTGEVAGRLVLVTAALDAQNACLIPSLGRLEDLDGTLPVFRKRLGLFLSHFFHLSSTLPFLCVQGDGTRVFQGPWLSSLWCECSGRLLEVHTAGVLCL